MNKNRKRVLVQYFLRTLKKKLEFEYSESPNPIFLKFFSRDELIEILKWLFLGEIPKVYSIQKMNEEQILHAIGSKKLHQEKNDEDSFETTLSQAESIFTDPLGMWKNGTFEIRQLLFRVRFG